MHPCGYLPLILTCLKDEKPHANLGKAFGTRRGPASTSLKYMAARCLPLRRTQPEEQLHGAFLPLTPNVSTDTFKDASEDFLSYGDNARNRSLFSCVFYRGDGKGASLDRGDLPLQRPNLLTDGERLV